MSDCRRNPTRDDPSSSHARHRDSVQSGERATDPSAAVAFIQGGRIDGMAHVSRVRAANVYLSRTRRKCASASSACARPLKIFSAANARLVSSFASLRDFSMPTIDG